MKMAVNKSLFIKIVWLFWLKRLACITKQLHYKKNCMVHLTDLLKRCKILIVFYNVSIFV